MERFLFRRRTFFLLLGTVALLFVAETTPKSFLFGLPLVILGQLVRLWSAGCLKKMDKLITAGPFALCRNPLYIGSFLILAGYLVMCSNIYAAIIGVVGFWLFHGGAVSHEEKMLRDVYGEDFDGYCRRVPRFLPKLCFAEARGGFSWEQFRSNREDKAVVTALVVVCLFALMAFMQVRPLELLGLR